MYSFSCISGSVYAPAASVHASVTCEFTPMHTPGFSYASRARAAPTITQNCSGVEYSFTRSAP